MFNKTWAFTDEQRERMISSLMSELVFLRTKAGISQEELSAMIGVTRQTYGALERGVRRMSWPTFLALILFFHCNQKTHDLIQTLDGIPQEMMRVFNGGQEHPADLSLLFEERGSEILGSLDEEALRAVRTMILVEYARCTSTPGEVVLRSFDGVNFMLNGTPEQPEARKAVRSIKKRAAKNDRKRDEA